MSETYRTPPESGPRCKVHPLAEGTEVCIRCGASACDVCATLTPAGVSCVACESRLRRRRFLVPAAIIVGIAAVVAVGAAFTGKRAHPELPSQPVPEPCEDAAAELRALTKLIASGDKTKARAEGEHFVSACHGPPGILFDAAMDAVDAEFAIAIATRMIEEAPQQASVWSARARAHDLARHADLASLDYRQALTLQRGDFVTSMEAASLLEQQGRACEASLTIADMLRTNYLMGMRMGDVLHAQSLRARQLWLAPACRAYEGTGSASFKAFESEGDQAGVQDVVFGTARAAPIPGAFMLVADLHASVLVTRAFAARSGLGLTDAKLWIPTPVGVLQAALASEQTVRIQHAVVGHVLVAVVDELPSKLQAPATDLDGMFGLDFVRRFHQTLDSTTDRLDLSALRAWAELSTEGPLDTLDDVNTNMDRWNARLEKAAAEEDHDEFGSRDYE